MLIAHHTLISEKWTSRQVTLQTLDVQYMTQCTQSGILDLYSITLMHTIYAVEEHLRGCVDLSLYSSVGPTMLNYSDV